MIRSELSSLVRCEMLNASMIRYNSLLLVFPFSSFYGITLSMLAVFDVLHYRCRFGFHFCPETRCVTRATNSAFESNYKCTPTLFIEFQSNAMKRNRDDAKRAQQIVSAIQNEEKESGKGFSASIQVDEGKQKLEVGNLQFFFRVLTFLYLIVMLLFWYFYKY